MLESELRSEQTDLAQRTAKCRETRISELAEWLRPGRGGLPLSSGPRASSPAPAGRGAAAGVYHTPEGSPPGGLPGPGAWVLHIGPLESAGVRCSWADCARGANARAIQPLHDLAASPYGDRRWPLPINCRFDGACALSVGATDSVRGATDSGQSALPMLGVRQCALSPFPACQLFLS